MDWPHAAAAVSAAYLGSLVEFVEALTIILAVAMTRGWQSAWAGTLAGLAVLAVIVVTLGPALLAIPVRVLQLVVGVLLLLFGMRWLRKAILRSAGLIALHDEEAAFADETRVLSSARVARRFGVDPLGFAAAFKAVVLEGVEVAFIVVTVGSAAGLLLPASLGAMAALGTVAIAGLVLHRPLTRVPENTLKFAVGLLIGAFGIFWLGEGIGIDWPGGDLVLFAILAALSCGAMLAVRLARRETPAPHGARAS